MSLNIIIDELKSINPRPQTLEECWVVIDKLIKINLELLERLNNNSKNSSLPPSQDYKSKRKISKAKKIAGNKEDKKDFLEIFCRANK